MSRDRDLAAKKYAGKESATDKKQRKDAEASARNRHGHWHGGADKAAAKGQSWSDKQP